MELMARVFYLVEGSVRVDADLLGSHHPGEHQGIIKPLFYV
ncbi:hypothetical protein [Lentzea albida]|nr:hypothetical protein [Lentzea albida]